MSPTLGLVYTLLLLTSSWCVARAVSALRSGDAARAGTLVTWGLGLGAVFPVLKIAEYIDKVASGYTPQTNDFYMYYFVLTFVHLLHVCVGLIVLAWMRRKMRGVAAGHVAVGREPLRSIECAAVYWHMVDLLWVVLFALFYLGR